MPNMFKEEKVLNLTRLGYKLAWGAVGLIIGGFGVLGVREGIDGAWYAIGAGGVCLFISDCIKVRFKVTQD